MEFLNSSDGRKFMLYLKKWLKGERIRFIKNDIRRNSELSSDDYNNEIVENSLSVDSYNIEYTEEQWIESIEDKALYYYTKAMPQKRRTLIFKNIILGIPLTHVASELNISKQLAYDYKQKYLLKAKDILSEKYERKCI